MNTDVERKIIIIIIYNLCVWPADMLHFTIFQMLRQFCQNLVDKSFCKISSNNMKYIVSKLFFLWLFSQTATTVTFLQNAENTERS